ncbi:hypothetical protein [uncultured Rubinisphaera sp.]|uniref:hypothetical protein n=1 Tax=uncultured Rubinisphaera sp. TaxID=1678686 RepID=UPI0030D81356
MTHIYSRRTALKQLAVAGLVPFVSLEQILAAPAEKLPPVRTITKGPKHHWFGYYDKLEFDPTNRYVLSNEVEFEHRTPNADDRIAVGMVDTQNNDEWIPLGKSDSWGWQQGCMLQWRPGSNSEVVWNDREGDQHVCRVKDIRTGATRNLPRPIYSLSPDGKWAITADFSRIQRMRPGYGYVGLEDPCRTERAPEESGVWRMDMTTGDTQLIFSLADAAAIPFQGKSLQEKWNYFNHLLVSPDSSRFIVLHRWRESTGEGTDAEPTGRFDTRMFTADIDGSNRYILDPSGYTSHFIWRDPNHVCAWTKPEGKDSKFYLFKDQTDQVEVVAPDIMKVNGHNTYLPVANGDWILNDTYPQGSERLQTPYLYHVPSGRRFDLGHFPLPSQYKGEWRCDLHPRSSNDGKTIAIDSPHTGAGRQVHLINVSEIVG